MWVCRQVAPWSPEWANHTSAVRASSPGRSLRMSYQVTATVPCGPAAIAGSNANALTPGSLPAVQVRPPPRDGAMPIAPGRRVAVLEGDVDAAVGAGRRAGINR